MSHLIRTIIADDELLARRRLRRLLAAFDDVEVAGECVDGAEVLELLRSEEPFELLLLDIHMPKLSGFEALALAPDAPLVVFTTAYAEHAVEAFEHEAVDYLLKPISAEGLARALERVRRRLPAREETLPLPPDRLPVPTRKGVVLLEPGDITHAVVDGVSCLIHTAGECYVTDFRLSDLEKRLPRDRFERLHRRALVNLYQVERLEPVDSGGYLARLKTGQAVAVSRQAARQLRKRWSL